MSPHEVGQEEDGALEDADEQQVAVGVVARRSPPPSSRHASLQVVGLDEDLADGRVAHRRGSLRAASGVSGGVRPRSAASPPPTTRPRAVAEVERGALGEARGSRPARAPTAGTRRPARLGQPADGRAGPARAAARAQRGERDLVARRRARSATTASSTSASSRSSAARAHDVALGAPGGRRAAPASRPCAHAGARERAGSSLVASSRQASPRGAAIRRRLARGVTSSSGRTSRPSRAAHAEQRAAAGRRREPVEDRLGLVGRRVRRRRRSRRARSAAPPPAA